MEPVGKRRQIAILSVAAAVVAIGVFWTVFPRTEYYKRRRIKQVLQNVSPPPGTRVDIFIESSKESQLAIGTYVSDSDCAGVKTHYQNEFLKRGFTYTGESRMFDPQSPSLIFSAPGYKAILDCRSKLASTHQPYNILLYERNVRE
jgi:hypothetical protein